MSSALPLAAETGPDPEVISALAYSALCLALGGTTLLLARIATRYFGTDKNSRGKYEAYECGVPQLGPTRIRFGVQYYLVALFFMLFDVETVFLLPYAVAYKKLGMEGFWGVTLFLVILGMVLWYLIKRGALEWD